MLKCRQSWGAGGEVEQTPKAQIPNGAVLPEPALFNKHSLNVHSQTADYGGGSADSALHDKRDLAKSYSDVGLPQTWTLQSQTCL